MVSELLKRQPQPVAAKKPRVLIVPHAGYQYSGLVAANGFRQLQGRHYDGVVVVGFTHQAQFDGASVDTREAYLTPLGEIPVDQEAVAVLQTYPGMTHVEAAHESGEHSLEVELPFLQASLDQFRLVPILMGGDGLQEAGQLADALAGLARLGDYLFVFSTDLSHYHPYDDAERIDDGTINGILSETPQAMQRLFAAGQAEACGRGPILTSLLLAQKLGYLKRELLYRANSGDTYGNPSSVVGYAAIGMFDRPTATKQLLSSKAGHALVTAARAILEEVIGASKTTHAPGLKGFSELAVSRGMFVTLRKNGQLRGCIGRIESNQPLAVILRDVAIDAATHDPRFPPVTAGELPDLEIEVSVLTPPTPLASINELVPSRDGVILDAQGHRGVFLPQVWDETGWTRTEFLQELASQKAGLAPDAWQRATLLIFQAQVFEESHVAAREAQ